MENKKYLILEANGKGAIYDIVPFENDYKQIRDYVGGLIERFHIPELEERNIDIWLNEEGKIENFEPTIVLFNNNGKYVDYLCGTVVFAKHTEEGDTVGLNEDDIDFILDWIKSLETCTEENSHRKYHAYRYKCEGIYSDDEIEEFLKQNFKPIVVDDSNEIWKKKTRRGA